MTNNKKKKYKFFLKTVNIQYVVMDCQSLCFFKKNVLFDKCNETMLINDNLYRGKKKNVNNDKKTKLSKHIGRFLFSF